MIKKNKVKKVKAQPSAEYRVRTKYRIRLGRIILAPNQIILVARNRGFNGKQDLGYYFFHNGRKMYLRKEDVEFVGAI